MLSLRIALRYLLSRKSHGAVNVISEVSMAGVAVAAAAMIIVLSVFNGFSQLVERKTSYFNPPLLVTRADGTLIADADSLAAALRQIPGVAIASPLIDEQAFAIASGAQMPVNMRALTPEAIAGSHLRSILVDGSLPDTNHPSGNSDSASVSAILSVGAAMGLNARPQSSSLARQGLSDTSFTLCEPARRGRINPGNPAGAFRSDTLSVTAVFQVEQEEQDRDMLIVPLATARDLLDFTTEATAVALYPASDTPGAVSALKSSVQSAIPAGYNVLDRAAQEAGAYRMIAIEKWITFLMLLFILAVASFNIISTLSLMVVEKQKNMAVIAAMGGTRTLIGRVFANQGWLITLLGGLSGLLFGSLLTLGQQHFGWIRLTSQNPALMAVDSYPVALHPSDLLIILAAIILTSLLISLIGYRLPSRS